MKSSIEVLENAVRACKMALKWHTFEDDVYLKKKDVIDLLMKLREQEVKSSNALKEAEINLDEL